ncbi:unnamed protein product, partial [Prorocentrum cordatum]
VVQPAPCDEQGEEEWSATPPAALQWVARAWRLLEVMLEAEPDLLCLQELDHFGDFFARELGAAGYGAVLRPRPCPAEDATAVLWRRDAFRLLGQDDSLDYAAVAVLEDQGPAHAGRRLLVASAHLRSGKTAEAERERAAQVGALLDLAAELAERWAGGPGGAVPLVLGADLNAVPQADGRAGPPLAYGAALAHPVGLRSAYGGACCRSEGAERLDLGGGALEAPYTTWKLRPKKGEIRRTVDFIFHSAADLEVAALMELPRADEMPPERLPTFAYPSDHLAIAADLRYAGGGGVDFAR